MTGGSRGIGKQAALKAAEQGWNVAFTYRSNRAKAEEVVETITSMGRTAIAYQVDSSNEEEVRNLFRQLGKELSKPQAVVINAGITRDGFAATMSKEAWQAVIDTNLTGAFLCVRESIKAMRKTGGAIVFVSSISGRRSSPGQVNYSASKGGIDAMTRTLSKELASLNIRVNAVSPGFIGTDMVAEMNPDARKELTAQIPMKRLGTPEEVASVITFLIGEQSSYVTGQILGVDGGLGI